MIHIIISYHHYPLQSTSVQHHHYSSQTLQSQIIIILNQYHHNIVGITSVHHMELQLITYHNQYNITTNNLGITTVTFHNINTFHHHFQTTFL